jgi:magnesium transporter
MGREGFPDMPLSPPMAQTKATTKEPGPPSPSDPEPAGRLRAHIWRPGHELEAVTSIGEFEALVGDETARFWIDVEDASPALLTRLAASLRLHPLVVEDIVERNQRAKVEYTGDHLHVVMFAPVYRDVMQPVEVDIVLGDRFLLTSHPDEWDPIATLGTNRLGVDFYLGKGVDFALYGVVDALVDGYFPVVDRLSDEVDELEDEILGGNNRVVLERMFRVRRALIEVRRAVSPEREVFNQLTNRELPLISADHLIYFRDVYDHLIRITDELDTHRELLTGVLDAYLSTVNNTLSDVMKRLTAVTAILAGIGAIAGIFGMSEAAAALDLREGVGFWLVTAFVLAVGGLVFAYFRRIGWI